MLESASIARGPEADKGLKTPARGADTTCMGTSGEDRALTELDGAYAEYRGAMTGWHAACKAADAGTTERAAERLLQARVDLYQRLRATGWEPPPAVVVQLDRDAALVAAPGDFDALLGI